LGGRISNFAVIGAGVAGTYIALRLACGSPDLVRKLVPQQKGKPIIQVFDALNSPGVRLCSPKMPGMQFLKAELGGMCYAEKQILLTNLVRHLGLTPKTFGYLVKITSPSIGAYEPGSNGFLYVGAKLIPSVSQFFPLASVILAVIRARVIASNVVDSETQRRLLRSNFYSFRRNLALV
jgi:hypothetical protein